MDPVASCSVQSLQRRLPDQTLDDIARGRWRLMASILTCSITWVLGAITMMTSAFTTVDCSVQNDCSMVTLVDEFDLRESRRYLVEWSTSFFMIGNMLGGAVLTRAADKFGRRPVLLLCIFIQATAALCATVAPSIQIFNACRMVQGAFYTGTNLVAWVTAYEMSPTSRRALTTLIFGVAWVIGYCAVAPLAYFSPSWREMLLFGSGFPLVSLVIACYFFVPETLHFLVSQKDSKKIEKWIDLVDPALQCDVALLMKEHDQDEENVNLKTFINELAVHKLFIVYCLVQLYLWTCDNFIYFGLSLYSTQLAGNIYVNYILIGIVELPASVITPPALDWFGRRNVAMWSHFLAASSFLLNLALPAGNWQLAGWLLCKLAISISFMSLFVYASEIFPTSIRNIAIGLCSVLSRAGGIFAPHLHSLSLISPMAPVLALSVIASVAGFLTMFLPETKQRPLPTSLRL